jgi:hypothetical protein
VGIIENLYSEIEELERKCNNTNDQKLKDVIEKDLDLLYKRIEDIEQKT